MSRFLPPALVVALALSSTALAEQPRVVVVLDESTDGKKAATSSAEIAVTSSLTKDGWRVVAGDSADKLRKAQAVALALTGTVPDVLSSLDADLVLLGQVEVAKIGTLEEAGLVGFRAVATAKLVRVDTAQIVDAFSVDAKGSDFTAAGGAQKAAKNVGEELAKAVKASVLAGAKKPRTIDLVVHGVADRAGVEALKASLTKVKGVSDVVVRQSGKGLTKIELASSIDAEALATQLDRSGAPLEIVQTSAASILARHDVRRGVKLGASLLAPIVKLAANGAWLKGALGPLVEAELQNVTWLDVVPSSGDVTLTVEAATANKDGIALSITVTDAQRRKLFVAASTGKLDDVPALVSAVIEKLDDGFLPALARAAIRGAPEGALARAAAAGRAPAATASLGPSVPELRIEALSIESLFPAKIGHYQDNPVGSLVVKHMDPKGEAAVDVVVSVYVSRFMQLKTDIPVGTIEPGETRTVPLKVGLDGATVFAVEENTPTQAEVVVEYRGSSSDAKRTARRVAPVVVYGRHAIDWSENDPIVAFVTPQEENVRTFARAALVPALAPSGADTAGALPSSVVNAVAIFSSMNAAELKYLKDAATPARSVSLDTVQFARETLTSRSGDCDDLSVLYASLLESVGVETAFILVPGHVLIGVSAGVPPDASERVSVDASKLVVHEGKAWVPVETTARGKSFREAWALGAAVVARARKEKSELVVVETRTGWAKYPPAALPRAAGLAVPRADPSKSGAIEEVRLVVAARDQERSARMLELAAAAANDPSSPLALVYAASLSRAGDVVKARLVLEAAVKKSPANLAAHNSLANLEVLTGDSSAAVVRYRALLDDKKAAGRKGEVLTNLGLAYARAGDTARAVDAFDAALASGSTSVFVATGFVRTPSTGRVTAPGTRADDAGTTTLERDLRGILEKAVARNAERAAKKGASVPVDATRFAPPSSSARGGDDAASRARAAELLRWWS